MQKLFVFWATALLAGTAAAQSHNYDVRDFDVAGVKLGMTADEARAALKGKLGVGDGAFQDGFKMMNRATGTKRPTGFSVRHNGIDINVGLNAKIPVDSSQTMVVSSVHYRSNGTADAGEMRKQAIAKYGHPTKGKPEEPGHFRAQWCTLENPYAGCETVKAYLSLQNGEMKLHDSRFRDAEDRWANEKQKTKQVF